MKIGPNSMQNPWNPQNTKFLSAYAPFDHAETVETGHRVKSQIYVIGLDPKRSKSKFQNFKLNTMSIVALHTQVNDSETST